MSALQFQIQPLVPLVDEFAGRLFSELDYVQEGKNAELFEVHTTLSLAPSNILMDVGKS